MKIYYSLIYFAKIYWIAKVLHKYTIGIAVWKRDTEVHNWKVRYRGDIALSNCNSIVELAVSRKGKARPHGYRSFVERERHAEKSPILGWSAAGGPLRSCFVAVRDRGQYRHPKARDRA